MLDWRTPCRLSSVSFIKQLLTGRTLKLARPPCSNFLELCLRRGLSPRTSSNLHPGSLKLQSNQTMICQRRQTRVVRISVVNWVSVHAARPEFSCLAWARGSISLCFMDCSQPDMPFPSTGFEFWNGMVQGGDAMQGFDALPPLDNFYQG